MKPVTNIVIGGLGGQGVVTASDILADAAFLAGHDVKKSDIHGMAQRGGSVSSDIRFGSCVFSPMIPTNEADYVVILDESRYNDFAYRARRSAVILSPSQLGNVPLSSKKATNIALLGLLTRQLRLDPQFVELAMRKRLKPTAQEASLQTFRLFS